MSLIALADADEQDYLDDYVEAIGLPSGGAEKSLDK